MLRTLVIVLSFMALASSSLARDLQDVPPPPAVDRQRPQSAPTPQPRPAPGTPAVAVPVPSPAQDGRPKLRGRDLNVQVEITITDQIGSGAPEKKVVSLLAADQTQGRVRANANARQKQELGFVGTSLNVDAWPTVLDNDRVLLQLTIEYMPLRDTPQVLQQPTNLNESISVILQSGKSLTISQAADPISDRRMTVEAKATVVR